MLVPEMIDRRPWFLSVVLHNIVQMDKLYNYFIIHIIIIVLDFIYLLIEF